MVWMSILWFKTDFQKNKDWNMLRPMRLLVLLDRLKPTSKKTRIETTLFFAPCFLLIVFKTDFQKNKDWNSTWLYLSWQKY